MLFAPKAQSCTRSLPPGGAGGAVTRLVPLVEEDAAVDGALDLARPEVRLPRAPLNEHAIG